LEYKKYFKWGEEPNSPQLGSNTNRFAMLDKVAENIFIYNLNNKKLLREVIVKIGLERVDMQKEVTVEMLLDSGAIELVMSLEFVRK